jgi:hypothetical protein
MSASTAEDTAAIDDDIFRAAAEPRRSRAERLASKRTDWSKFVPLALVAIAVLFNLFVLRAEVRPVAPPNDTSVHVSLVRFAEQRINDGKLVFDSWYPRLSMGLPAFHHYQSLAPIIGGAIATQFGAARTVAWSNFLLACTLPLCFYWAIRLLGFNRWVAGIAALFVPLISSVTLYGYEHGSFQWRGNGIWTALWGMWLLPLTLAFTYRSIARGRAYALAALFLALTITAHFLTGYLALLALGVWVIVKPSELLRRVGRAAIVSAGGMLVAAWVVVPLLADGKWSNRSEYNVGAFWYDSAGGKKVMWWLGTGQLLDYRHWPIVTLLAAVGVVICIWRFRSDERSRVVLAFTIMSLLLFCGRDTIGFIADRLPGGKDLQLHRYIIGVHLGGIVLAAIGAAWLVQLVYSFLHTRLKGVPPVAIGAGILVLGLVALAPAWRERAHYNALNATQIAAQQVADRSDGQDFTALVDTAKSLGDGRIYAGQPGHSAVIGQVPTYEYVLRDNADVVGFMLRTVSLSSDVETRFDSTNAAHFDLFNARYIIQPSAQPPAVPATFLQASGRWGLWAVPTSGYLQVVDTTAAINADRTNLGRRTAEFLSSTLPAQRLIPVIAFDGAHGAAPTVGSSPPAGPAGVITQHHNRPDDGVFGGTVIANRNAVVMLKATFDPHMKVTVDGRPSKTQMLAPSFIGVAVTPGQHTIEFRYVAFGYYWALFLLGGLTLAALALVPRYGRRWMQLARPGADGKRAESGHEPTAE